MLKLKEIRQEKGLYQKDIAQMLNKTITCICDWERGRTEPSIQDLLQLANYFEVSTDYLLGRSNDIGVIETNANLTSEETELLSLFNQMSFRDKNRLLGFAQGLIY